VVERILVVDDDQEDREALAKNLVSLQYAVETAKDGQEALSKYRKGDYEVILADMFMPNVDGIELLRRIREVSDDVIFFMMTDHPSIGTAVESVKRGADDYITKPCHLEDVKIRILKAIEGRSVKGRLKSVQGLAWGLMLSIPLWLLLGIVLVILLKG
jgi:two-component system nitrogen regulation response regulator NtrX